MKRPTPPPGRIIKEGPMFTQLQVVGLTILMSLTLLIMVLAPEDTPTPLAEISRGPATTTIAVLGAERICVLSSNNREVNRLITAVFTEFENDEWNAEREAHITALATEALNASGCLNEP